MEDATGSKLSGVVLDLDGTICVGERLIDGAAQAVEDVRALGLRVTLLSNSIDGRDLYAKRLQRLGMRIEAEDIFTATEALALYLRQFAPGAKLYALADPPLEEILSEDFTFADEPDQIDVVIASVDRSFNFDKLNTAFQALRRGAHFVATNTDPTAPFDGGVVPDAGAIIGALEACSGRRVEQVVGKPSPFMINRALAYLECPANQALLVGDRIEADVVMAKQAGMLNALVLTGVTSPEELMESLVQPDFVLQSVRELPALVDTLR